MHNAFSAILGLMAPLCFAATISNATAAPPAKAAEDRYIAARDAAIEKISAIYDAGNADDAARKAEEAASADLAAQMRVILNEAARAGFGPAKLHIDTFNKGDEGFGEGNQQHRVNGLRWGIDSWLYVGNGDSGGMIKSSLSGQTYRVQYKNNLDDLTWTDLTPDVTAGGATATKMDSVGSQSQRFYRVSIVCP